MRETIEGALLPERGAGAGLARGGELARRVLFGSPTAMVGAVLLAVHVGLAVVGPIVAPFEPTQFHIIIFCEMLPNAWAPIIVELTIRFAYAILLATSLGFLGLGAQPPAPDWGLMINEALPFLAQAPWLAILPAVAISSAVVGANLVGDAIRETLALGRTGEAL